MSIALNVLENELKQTVSKFSSLRETIEELGRVLNLDTTKEDFSFYENKIADLKAAIQKLKQTA